MDHLKRLSLGLLGSALFLTALAPTESALARPTRPSGSPTPAPLTTPVGPRPSTSTVGLNAGVLAAPTPSTNKSATMQVIPAKVFVSSTDL